MTLPQQFFTLHVEVLNLKFVLFTRLHDAIALCNFVKVLNHFMRQYSIRGSGGKFHRAKFTQLFDVGRIDRCPLD